MRFLFISYIFPGPLAAMASWLASQPENQVIFASTRSRQELPLPNVQRVIVKTYPAKKSYGNPDYFDLWEEAARAGNSVRSSLELVKSSGFEPDMIFIASSNGAVLGLRQIFPDAFLINFLEEEDFASHIQAAVRKDIQELQILQANLSFAFTERRKQSYPRELWAKIGIAPQVIDCAFFDPAKAIPFKLGEFSGKREELITVFARDLDDKGLFNCWQSCLDILQKRPNERIALLVTGSYVQRRLENLEKHANLEQRLYVAAHLRQDSLRDLLSSSLISVFPKANFSKGLLESMSCASCPLTCTHKYFLKNGWDCMELDMRSPIHMGDKVAALMAYPEALAEMGAHARSTALKDFDARVVMPRFFPQIMEAYKSWNG